MATHKHRSPKTYYLWEGLEKPYYKENNVQEYEEDCWGTRCVFDVTDPTLTIYPAQKENLGTGVIIIPGGGYSAQAIYSEGHEVASALARQGVTAAVLKYRSPDPETSDQPEQVPLADTRRALSLLRSMSRKYGIHKKQIGLLGFSSGSHLATLAGLWKSDQQDENPDFAGLLYGSTRLTKENLQWLEEELYFRKLAKTELAQNRLLELVTRETPPAFMVHACDDEVCQVDETTLYAQKLIAAHVPVEVHLFPKGGHGFGLGRKKDGTNQWVKLFVHWLKVNFTRDEKGFNHHKGLKPTKA